MEGANKAREEAVLLQEIPRATAPEISISIDEWMEPVGHKYDKAALRRRAEVAEEKLASTQSQLSNFTQILSETVASHNMVCQSLVSGSRATNSE